MSDSRGFAVRPVALSCIAAACLACMSAQAGVTSTGSNNTFPGSFPLGPGNTNVGGVGMFVGNGAFGSLAVDAGSLLSGGSLTLGSGGPGLGDGRVVIDGVGTRVNLVGDGFTDGILNRFEVGAWGRGVLTISNGAVLDGRSTAAACLGANHFCNNFVGGAAGSDGTFTVTGAGSQASFLRGFFVGGVSVFAPPIVNFTFGTPGGSTQGRVNVLEGGLLTTDGATVGLGPNGPSGLGTERSFADVVIRGTGSTWKVQGPTLETGGAYFVTAEHRDAWATVNISQGGRLLIEGRQGVSSGVILTGNGGRTDALVTGAGSLVEFTGGGGELYVGHALGTATLDLRDGAEVRGARYTAVGQDASLGVLSIDGAGTRYLVNGTVTVAGSATPLAPAMDIGNRGLGVVNLTNGARLEVTAAAALSGGPTLTLGRGAAAAGTLNISSGSTVLLSSESTLVGGGAGEAFNPFLSVGHDGSGTLRIGGGGQLLLEGKAVSTVADTRRTTAFIGGGGEGTVGGNGTASIDGLGSALRVTGSDAYIGVGHGLQANGQLTVSNQASIASTILGVGNSGGTGVLRLDNARADLTGQYTGFGEYGAALVVGAGANGVGVIQASHGALIHIANLGSNGGGVTIGGSGALAGGEGSITLSASRIEVVTQPGLAGLTVGRTGNGLLRLQDGSRVDVAGGNIFVGRESGSDGVVVATGGSSINAGWVGVGRNLNAGVDADGGTGTMVLNGATLTAQKVVVGTNGFLGGTSGSITAGEVVNYGTFSPGNSPGTFTINGSFTAGAGSRLILEVASDGAGGFNTDHVVFSRGSAIDLGAMRVEFRFLGQADPNAFAAAHAFDIDSFLSARDSGGQTSGLDTALFSSVSFSARADSYRFQGFSFTAADGASFTAVPVPEPGTWLMWLGGVGLLVLRRRELVRQVGGLV
jgi:PEP-CTERM motif